MDEQSKLLRHSRESGNPASQELVDPRLRGDDDAEGSLNTKIIDALKTVYDPEIPSDIYEMGMIYKIDTTPNGDVTIRMTLTSPACPVAGSLPGEVEQKIRAVPGVTSCTVELVWDPPWEPSMMSEVARLQLHM